MDPEAGLGPLTVNDQVLTFDTQPVTPPELASFYASAGWHVLPPESFRRALSGTYFSLSARAPGGVFENGREALLTCVGYLRDLVARGRELLADGLTEEAIRDALFGGESSFAALTHGEFSSGNLTRAVLAARTTARGLTSPDGGGHGGP